MSVSILDNGDQWDRFVDASPHGTLFHRWRFLKIVERHSGYKLFPFGVYRGRELTCVFPIFYKSYGGMTMVFSPPPRAAVPNLGPIMSPAYDGLRQRKKESNLNVAIDEINEEIARFSPGYAFISTVNGFPDARPFMWAGYDVRVNYTYVLGLDKPLDEIWDGFDADCKKSIRSGDRYHLTIEQTRDVGTFYDIMLDRFGGKGLNSPVMGAEYLTDLLDAFPDNIRMHFAYCDGDIAAIALNCEYKGRFMFWMGEINVRRDIPSNEYLKWAFIRDAKARGLREVELEGAGIRQLCMYKAKFNPALRQNYFIYKKGIRGSVAEWAYRNLVARKMLG